MNWIDPNSIEPVQWERLRIVSRLDGFAAGPMGDIAALGSLRGSGSDYVRGTA